jgi:NADPH-dependent curcumin reductase CurA
VPRAEHFAIVTTSVPSLQDGEILVRNEYLSVDPAMRGWVNVADNYRPPVPIGSVMPASAVGRVVDSRSSRFRAGDLVVGRFGWQEHAVVRERGVDWVVDERGLPPSLSLGVLGVNGITAWFGVRDILRPLAGGTVVVSTAAGAVGSVVGQLASSMGCRTVGITGGSEKVDLCRSLYGYDAAVDYRSPNFAAELRAACPEGVDAYFDNTGGQISDEVLPLVNVHASVAVCGTAALPVGSETPVGPRVERLLLTRRARMQGLLVGDFRARFPEAVSGLTSMVRDGLLVYREDVLEGLEAAPSAVEGLYTGANLGKRVIKLDVRA